jgi:hypothetical protein
MSFHMPIVSIRQKKVVVSPKERVNTTPRLLFLNPLCQNVNDSSYIK